MDTFKSFIPKLYNLNEQSFDDIALQLFHFQAAHNRVYHEFLQHLSIVPATVRSLTDVPFLPIAFFKTHTIQTGEWSPEAFFSSSGTTHSGASKHAVHNLNFYLVHARKCFEYFFGPLQNYHFLALLPSYLERSGSSLITMIDSFIKESQSPRSGFYLHDHDKLLRDISQLKGDNRATVLWGVSFALLDLADKYNVDLSHCVIMETGGMKGRRKEITRQELHQVLKDRLNARKIYSEYGMTELLSQAYTTGDFGFKCPPWMKIIGRDLSDPFHRGLLNETSGINVIDLANCHSVSFIETEDLGKVQEGGTFEILGRVDNSEIRGCNLMI